MSPRWGCTLDYHDGRPAVHSPNMSEATAKDLFEGWKLFVSATTSIVLWRREYGKKIAVERAAHRSNLLRLFT